MSLFKIKMRSPIGETVEAEKDLPVDTLEEATAFMEESIDRGNIRFLIAQAQLTGVKVIIPGRLLSVEMVPEGQCREQPEMPDDLRAFLESLLSAGGAK